MSSPGFPLLPPFFVTASYQNKQYGSGSIYTPGIPSVFSSLVSPPTSGTVAETESTTDATEVAFTPFAAQSAVMTITVNGGPAGGTFFLQWGDISTSPLAFNASAATVQAALIPLVAGMTRTGTNAVQTVTISGVPTGGTFTLTYAGQTTTALAFNATAATVQAALIALSNIGPNDVTVTGGPGPATPYVVTFVGTLGDEPIALMTATSSFTGGTSPTTAVTSTTTGVTTPNITVAGSNGGPYTATFTNLLANVPVAQIAADGSALTGGTNPSVTVVTTTRGRAAFVNDALQDAHRHRDPMYDFNDLSAGMHF